MSQMDPDGSGMVGKAREHAMRRAMMTALLATGLVGAALAGDERGSGLAYWPREQREEYARYESVVNSVPTRESLLAYHQLIASEPHVAGTPGDLRNVERIAKAFEEMGLEVRKHQFWAYLCRPIESAVEVVSPEHIKLSTAEEPLEGDAFSGHADRMGGWNAYSGSGDVTAEVVYANYGRKEDYAKLAELKVDVKGKVVVCRYGGNYRGFKAKFAEEAGAAAVVIYTDPSDAGYMKGLTYPEGGYANSMCIERGSLTTLGYSGDPLTPGVEATQDAKRLDPATLDLPRIPVQPIGYAAAGQILTRMKGEGVPAGWQGGLPTAYRVTGGAELKVRVKVEQERAIIPTFNIIGTLRGVSEPETMVVIGCHHDAWSCGASDPTCGTIALMESARSFAELAKMGMRPARTMLFCAWGAEEFGIIGSTEWVEGNREQLIKHAALYINLDAASGGVDFSAATSPSLRRLVAEASRSVPAGRNASKTVFEAWIGRGEDKLVPGMPVFGDMGGGSDHIGFLCHAGIASTSLMGGGSKGTAYHSTYDTLPWYWKVVGEDYESALMVTRMTSAVAGRMASAPLLPLNPARYGVETRRHLIDLSRRAAEAGLIAKSEREVAPELARLEGAAVAFGARAAAVEAKLAAMVGEGTLDGERLAKVNELLIAADRAWLSEEGIPGRPWFKNLAAASDEDSGYASWILPGLRWAVERKDGAALAREQERYLEVFERLTKVVEGLEGAAR